MPKVDFSGARKEAEASGLLGSGGFFKFKEGDNRLRLMSECLPHTSMFDGKKNFKWLCYVLDRVDGEIKPFFMPHKIYKAIEALQLNPDYAFDEVPMPYDLTVNAKKAGTKDVEYALIPARRESPLTEDEIEKLDHAKPLRELKQAIDDKQQSEKGGVHPSAPPAAVTGELTDDDIPFSHV
jgi:hypothetical protein